MIKDIGKSERVNPIVKEMGFNSVMAVPLRLDSHRNGVLYVFGRQPNQFTNSNLGLVQTLADHGALALGWAFRLLQPIQEITKTTSKLIGLPDRLEAICKDVTKRYGFDGVNLQLVRNRINVIETVYGTGNTAHLVGLKHRLDVDKESYDIQADIALATKLPRADITRGCDYRFHRWMYNRFEHWKQERVLLPLILIRDRFSGKLIEDWENEIQLDWKVKNRREGKVEKKCKTNSTPEGMLTRFELSGIDPDKHWVEIIGTLGCSVEWARLISEDKHSQLTEEQYRAITREEMYLLSPGDIEGISGGYVHQISEQTVQRLLTESRQIALDIHDLSLTHVLETIAEQAMAIVDADCATIHFAYEPRRKKYAYEAGYGSLPSGFPETHRPRPHGQGREAIRTKCPVIHPSGEEPVNWLELNNPSIWDEGVQTLAAFPVFARGYDGVLYLHFSKLRPIPSIEQAWVELFTKRAQETVEVITSNTSLQGWVRQGEAIHAITGSLAKNPEDPDLLEDIAWTAHNLFGADLVSVLEYNQDVGQCISKPVWAGNLYCDKPICNVLYKATVVEKLEYLNRNVYVEQANALDEFRDPDRKNKDIVKRERLESGAFIRLQFGTEMMGVMCINYRQPRGFYKQEQKAMEALADAAAIIIRNRRVLKRRQQDLATIAHQLQAPLNAAVISLHPLAFEDLVPETDLPALKSYLARTSALVGDALIQSNGIVASFGREAGRSQALSPTAIAVPDFLENLVKRLRLTESRDDLRFRFHWTDDLPCVYIDLAVLTNVFYSLVHNALKYADRDSTVHLSGEVGEQKGSVRLAVTSTGEPIEPQENKAIFEKFRRGSVLKKTGRHHGGIGLGLWVANELLKAVGESLSLELFDDEPRCSRFVVMLHEYQALSNQQNDCRH